MHDPICLDSLRWSTLVENKSFLHPHILGPAVNCFVCAGGFPVTRHRCSIGSDSIRVLPVPGAEEVPFIFSKLCFLCINIYKQQLVHIASELVIWVCNIDHTNQAIAKGQTCRYQLLGLWRRGRALKWLGF